MDNSLLDKLNAERRYYESTKSVEGFPRGFCDEVPVEIAKKYGMEIHSGNFIDLDGEKHTHIWNYNKETREIVDLTADQFGDFFPEVYTILDDSADAKKFYETIRKNILVEDLN